MLGQMLDLRGEMGHAAWTRGAFVRSIATRSSSPHPRSLRATFSEATSGDHELELAEDPGYSLVDDVGILSGSPEVVGEAALLHVYVRCQGAAVTPEERFTGGQHAMTLLAVAVRAGARGDLQGPSAPGIAAESWRSGGAEPGKKLEEVEAELSCDWMPRHPAETVNFLVDCRCYGPMEFDLRRHAHQALTVLL
ncbi:unnamed protein product [Symbiodinium sp. CCMP2592]|nr:unnamed protein product [Symbiodinium sp. CCMP2592]